MTTIDLNVPLKGTDGVDVPNQTLGKALSEVIATQTEGKTMKLYGWHKTLQVGDPLMLDDSDKLDLEKLIDEHKTMFIFVKGQLLEAIKNSK
jgi:hypothetical protein